MVHQFELSRSPKSLLVPAIAATLILASVAVIVFYHVLLGIVALVVSGYLSYHLVKFFVNTLRSHVRTSDDGLVCATATGSDSSITWDEMTHAGWYTSDSGYRELFVYAEQDDKLLTIPPQYEHMDQLEHEIAERTGLSMLSLAGEEVDGVADALRSHIVPEGEVIDDETEE